ncbi:MAG: hypothetical protein HKN33_02700 [Pyrinomonadaceae bacterium]|nr:hypothetical protein [Pyrinomonadaceae bacterium]
MKIAKVVSSNSHVEYIARVLDSLDVSDPPVPGSFGFGSFVSIGSEGSETIGVVFNSLLLNPEYASFGPRLSSDGELATFSPDFLHEQGSLLAILLLGNKEGENDSSKQSIPFPVIPPGSDVSVLEEEDFRGFHTNDEGNVSLKYYSLVLSHAGSFAVPLLETVIEKLSGMCDSEGEKKKLEVLRKSLVWQRTVGQMRL